MKKLLTVVLVMLVVLSSSAAFANVNLEKALRRRDWEQRREQRHHDYRPAPRPPRWKDEDIEVGFKIDDVEFHFRIRK